MHNKFINALVLVLLLALLPQDLSWYAVAVLVGLLIMDYRRYTPAVEAIYVYAGPRLL